MNAHPTPRTSPEEHNSDRPTDQPTTRTRAKNTKPEPSSKTHTDQYQPPHYKITTTTYLCITIRWAERPKTTSAVRPRNEAGQRGCCRAGWWSAC